ncbi:MAG: class I SAM-dependent methyltransferase [Clostridia bacterium]|nr:class I SAM-dependent methyltransferase [Clostridia bacterium]
MLDSKGFDLWANGYDVSVGISDNDNKYPFAGYKEVLNEIYNCILESSAENILDIGFGTGTLTTKLYENGCNIFGQDFSNKMIELAKAKMPKSKLFEGDFSKGLVNELKKQKYDAIIATYSLHHLEDEEKINFINELLSLLNENGKIYIGDVAFETRDDLEKCKKKCGAGWDIEEIYFVYDEIKSFFKNIEFIKFSYCSGVVKIW